MIYHYICSSSYNAIAVPTRAVAGSAAAAGRMVDRTSSLSYMAL